MHVLVNMSCALLCTSFSKITSGNSHTCMLMRRIHFQVSILEIGRFKNYLCMKVSRKTWMWPNGGLILIHHLYMHYRHYHGFCHFITFPLLSRSGNHNFKIHFLFPLHFQVFLINMIIFTIISFLLSPIWGGSCIFFYKSKWTNNPF